MISELIATIDALTFNLERNRTATDQELKQKDLQIEQLAASVRATEAERSTLAKKLAELREVQDERDSLMGKVEKAKKEAQVESDKLEARINELNSQIDEMT